MNAPTPGKRARDSVAGGSILAVSLKAAPGLLSRFGIEADVVAKRVGFDLRKLSEPEELIAFSLAARFVAECARATRCDHFGLLLGTEQGLGALGVVGLLVAHSRDVGAALQNLSSYLHHQEIGGVATLFVQRGIASLDYSIELRGLEAPEQVADVGLGIGISLMRFLCGATWAPREVHVMRPRPRDIAPYRRAFDAPVRFGAERNALLFDVRWLGHRIESADPVMRKILEARITELQAGHQGDFPSRVRGVLRAMLVGGESSCEAAADRLAVTRRTLHRRLAAHGVTFEQLLDQLRFDLSMQLLRHSAASLTEIAMALNYANASALTRAFRRWSGSSPSAWRAKSREPATLVGAAAENPTPFERSSPSRHQTARGLPPPRR